MGAGPVVLFVHFKKQSHGSSSRREAEGLLRQRQGLFRAAGLVPQEDPDNPVMISQGPSVCVFNKQDPGEVLASWLFTQFLLTNSVQIAYSSTEGYIPVTLKAQGSDEYTEYLSLEGADNDLHYSVKIQAAKLLLENVDNTFITPVFNGSASLRDAAGSLIESTAKAVRYGQTVDEA
ncbi:MAG: extracellular solute-binding protein, partial [Oscillospiraceae bacterium]|nr:extracellular solute-binding protein [Oscillospiraceae bacterium]